MRATDWSWTIFFFGRLVVPTRFIFPNALVCEVLLVNMKTFWKPFAFVRRPEDEKHWKVSKRRCDSSKNLFIRTWSVFQAPLHCRTVFFGLNAAWLLRISFMTAPLAECNNCLFNFLFGMWMLTLARVRILFVERFVEVLPLYTSKNIQTVICLVHMRHAGILLITLMFTSWFFSLTDD